MKKAFIGFHVSEATKDCLRLQSVLRGIGVAEVLRDIIDGHYEDNDISIDSLIDEIAEQTFSRWHTYWQEKMNYAAYIKKTAEDLRERQELSDELITLIVKACKEKNNR